MFEKFEDNYDDQRPSFTDIEYNLPDKRIEELNEGWAGHFKEHIFDHIDESKFTDMYSSDTGRPNFPVKVLVGLEIQKHMFNLPDKELVERFNFDLRCMKSLGLKEIGQLNLGPRTLYDFRERVVEYSKETDNNPVAEIFDELLDKFIQEVDLETEIQRMDSTLVDANIKHLSRIELMRRVFKNFVSDLREDQVNRIHKNTLKIIDDESFSEIYDYYTKEEVRENLMGKLLNVKQLFKNDAQVNELKSYELLCRLIEDQTIETSSELKEDEDISSDSLQNPHDEDATFRRKGKKSSQGYSFNISETTDPDNPVQMITDVSLQPNVHSDVDFLNQRLPEIAGKTDLEKMLVDGAYHGPESKKTAISNNTELIATNLTGRKPKYSTADFKIKSDKGIISCPAENTPYRTKYIKNSDTYAAWFKKSSCSGCSHRNKCPIKEQKKDMTVRFKSDRYSRDKYRARLETNKYQKLVKFRPAIEGTFSALKRKYGLAKFKVTGLVKSTINSIYKVLGYNSNQLFRYLKGRSRPKYST